MRLLVLTHEYPPIGGGGGRVALDLCQKFSAQGDEVHVLTMGWGNLPELERQGGLTIQRLNCGRKQPYKAAFMDMLRYILRATRAGLGLIRRWKPDLIHVHFAVPGGAAAWALSLLTRTPYVLTVHLGDVPGGVPEKTGRWFRWIYPFTPLIWRRAARVVAVSNYTRQLALDHYPLQIEVVPNGVDTRELDPGVIRLQDPPCLVFAGRFVPQKNPLQVVRTLAKLKDLPWHCAMLGDGAMRAEVEEEINRLGLGERFSLPGWVTPEQVIDWYCRSDILFMPSLSEGLPVAGVQALSMGLALVLSRAGGNTDLVVPGENGCLLDPDDSNGFEAMLRSLLENPARLLAFRQASRKTAEKFDLDNVVESYHRIFSSIC